ncbi:uncharacterized protein LOC127881618 isoform X2 [Dreissena polymorpha]|uniref:uncharacterized protein LOC127881026 isoform X2 n=1 Tax=Dreissena polymorpha TaxID=45954 RepID=UPI0022652616|nr:uncharacterized protein LOC127881026 isoform X2 [Dreissena polymorpha]XP_052285626.1 uncharacterized protein LOC127881618 isoform X2 [Dreissena polymorpha]
MQQVYDFNSLPRKRHLACRLSALRESVSMADLPTTTPNNNNNVKSTNIGKEQEPHEKSWKFWRSLSTRRSRKSLVHNGTAKPIEDGGFGVHVTVNLPDVLDNTDVSPSKLVDPPPKPPRVLHTDADESITVTTAPIYQNGFPRQLSGVNILSSPQTEIAKEYEGVDSSGICISAPPGTPSRLPPKSSIGPLIASSKTNSLPNYALPSSFQRRQQSITGGKIKIVSPELSRKVVMKPRKKSTEISAKDRHVLILQSSVELLGQKVDPFMILEKLAEAQLLDPKALNIYRNPLDSRYIIESVVQTVMDSEYPTFLQFCDILRSVADFTTVAAVLDAMRAIYDVIYEVLTGGPESSPILDDEKSVSFDVVYYSLDTGKIRSVVELEKLRNTESKRHSRDLLSFKRNSRLSFQSLSSEASSVFSEDIIINGLPMVTISVSGHALCLSKAIALADVVREHDSILELHIGKTHIRGTDMSHISAALVENYSVRVLDLRLNNIGNEGAAHLAKALTSNKTLRQLNLSSTGIDADGVNCLADALRTNVGLEDLDLSFLDIADSGCVALRDMLKQNRCLKKLRLRSANIAWMGCGLLLEGIEIGKVISELDLSRNFIGDAGADMLLTNLKDDSSLRDLNLENCGITVSGCSILSDVILTNKSLRHLDLSVNFIGDQGIAKLSNALVRNKHIKTLGLNMCGISNDGFSKLLDILESNTTLTLLKLCYNRLGKEHVDPEATSDNLKYRIRIVTSSNPKLKLLLWGNTFDEPHSSSRVTDISM